MKTKISAALCCFVLVLSAAVNTASAQSGDIQSFWKIFKAAVIKKDKNAVAALTKFPLAMPFAVKAVKSKADFLRRYDQIFSGEADAAKCFAKGKLTKENDKRYVVYCGFKATPNDAENTPVAYAFELTKNGWGFTGLDNINE
jgi:hypothetical protein